MIDHAEAREEWSRQAKGKAKERRLLELRETYADQLLNPAFTPADFRPEPLPPVQPAAASPPVPQPAPAAPEAGAQN